MTTRGSVQAAKPLPQPTEIAVKDLYLDPKNPRLVEADLTIHQQDEIVTLLWKERAVNELVDSIAASGYWRHEALFATKESGKLVVIEGNRRLTAVKLLTDDSLRQRLKITSIPSLGLPDQKKLETLPVIECSRQDVWQYIGFKHVNGPQDWDSIAKAEYIARVHNEYRVPLDMIARTIGDRRDTVRRLYRGLMVLKQAEQSGKFVVDDRYNTRFAFSHLWTGLGYENIQKFLGLGSDKGFEPNPVPKNHLESLRDLCLWLYGSKEEHKQPNIRSQNPDLRRLDETLGSKNGVAALRAGLPLDTALNASRGDERLLREALVVTMHTLKAAPGTIVNGYHGEEDLLADAVTILKVAESVVQEMQAIRQQNGTSGRRKVFREHST